MRNHILHIDENLLKVHPDLAALFKEVKEKENALDKLKAKQRSVKEELKATKNELRKRLNVLEAWHRKGESIGKSKSQGRRQANS